MPENKDPKKTTKKKADDKPKEEAKDKTTPKKKEEDATKASAPAPTAAVTPAAVTPKNGKDAPETPKSDTDAKEEAEPSTNGGSVSPEKRTVGLGDAPGKIRLTYFDGKGRAELARLILSAAEMEFEDRRITSEEWAEIKAETPMSQLPVLEFEGEIVSQSICIARFLAKKAGLYGATDVDQAHADMIVDYVTDFNNKWVTVFRATSYEEQMELIDNIFDTFLPKFFNNSEELLKKRGGKHFAGNKLSYADISMMQTLHAFTDPEDPFYSTLPGLECRFNVLDSFPLLRDLKERVTAVPGIKKWVDSRPQGLF